MFVVTEYGVAKLKGKSVRERARELIKIAHPDFADQLSKEAQKLGFI
ncbi:MAG: 4-hydroxybutyrate CoA-transferase, partial [Thaumarchaeota archaeon]|nr:4-hydroxybutyrate CoA-transferase [Nitrososphaerota archaeon]